jgi:transposase InsO family protein
MQRVHVGRDLFLERVGHRLQQLAAGACRKFRIERRDLCTRQKHDDPAAGGLRGGLGEGPAARGGARFARRRARHEHGGLRVPCGIESDQEPLSHQFIP